MHYAEGAAVGSSRGVGRVQTVCIGQAASMGAVLLCAGAAGKRQILPHSRVMIHQPHGGAGGTSRDIEIQAREIVKLRSQLNQILADATGRPFAEVERDTDRDRYLTASEAKEYGLVDEVLTKPPVSAEEEAKD